MKPDADLEFVIKKIEEFDQKEFFIKLIKDLRTVELLIHDVVEHRYILEDEDDVEALKDIINEWDIQNNVLEIEEVSENSELIETSILFNVKRV